MFDFQEEESSDEPAAVKTTFNVKITKYDESKKGRRRNKRGFQ